MNYQEMSDFEINCEVGRKISFADYLMARNEQVNYCNSWADAGPIIQDNFIDLESIYRFTDNSEENIEPTGSWCARGIISGQVNPRCEDANPLRAAMIVFLMMKGGE